MKDWTSAQFDQIWYSDECNFTLTEKRAYVRKKDQESWNDPRFRRRTKVRPKGVHVWMLISKEGVEHLVWTKGKKFIDAQYYCTEILEPYIIKREVFQSNIVTRQS